MSVPHEIEIVSGAMAMDGGSIVLSTDAGRIRLDWSIDARRQRRPQLFVNDRPIPKRSEDETAWIAALRSARIRPTEADPQGERVSENRIVLGGDIRSFFRAVDQGPDAALDQLRQALIEKVLSDQYVKPLSSGSR